MSTYSGCLLSVDICYMLMSAPCGCLYVCLFAACGCPLLVNICLQFSVIPRLRGETDCMTSDWCRDCEVSYMTEFAVETARSSQLYDVRLMQRLLCKANYVRSQAKCVTPSFETCTFYVSLRATTAQHDVFIMSLAWQPTICRLTIYTPFAIEICRF